MRSTTHQLMIDPEFAGLLPPLTPMQLEELRASIEQRGLMHPIIVWANHDDTIIDGHNRYKICQELGIAFRTEAKVFKDRAEVLKFIYSCQAGRRNLTAEQLSYVRGKVYEARKQTKAEAGAKGGASKAQDGPCFNTAEQVASEFGVSRNTIKRNAEFAKEVDEQVAAAPLEEREKVKQELLSGKLKPKADGKQRARVKQQQVTAMSWNKALAKAAKKNRTVDKHEFTEMLGINDTITARKGLSVIAQSKGFIVERNGSADSYRVSRAFVMPMKSDDIPDGLLQSIKQRAAQVKEDLLDGNNASVRWTLCVDFANDLLAMLKDVK